MLPNMGPLNDEHSLLEILQQQLREAKIYEVTALHYIWSKIMIYY